MHARRNAALAGAATLAALAAPGAASAATLAPLKPCYVAVPTRPQLELITIAGAGYTPNGRVDIAVDGVTALTGAPVDAAGNIAPNAQVPAPFVARRDKPFTVTATDQGNPANVVTATSQVTALNVGIQRAARGCRAVSCSAAAASPAPGRSTPITATRAGPARRSTFTPSGPCGRFTTRRTQIPVARPGTGSLDGPVDQQRRYARVPSSVFVRLTINVTRTVRFSRTLEGFGLPR